MPETVNDLDDSVRGNKRKRHNTRGSFEEIHVSKNVTSKIVRHISFSTPQNNNEGEDSADAETEPDVYQVVRGAETLWRAAKKHATFEQKAKLRGDAIKKALEEGNPPLWSYGLAPLPDFLQPMPAIMVDLMNKQAEAMAKLAVKELKVREGEDKNISSKQMEMVRDYYDKTGDGNYQKAQDRLQEVLVKYGEEETKRLEAYHAREQKRYPATTQSLVQMFCARGQPSAQGATRSRSGSGGSRKRRREDPSPNNRGRGADNQGPQAGSSANGNARQGNSAGPSIRGRGGRNNQRGQKRQGGNYQGQNNPGGYQAQDQRGNRQYGQGQRGRNYTYPNNNQRGGNRGNYGANSSKRGNYGGNSNRGNWSAQERTLANTLRDILRIR
jgi:hypothetical protein